MNKPSPARNELQQSLARLHTELASTSRVNEASRRLLREVLADIERLLSVAPSAGPASTNAKPAVVAGLPIDAAPHRLEALAVEFEAGHPTLAATLRQFVELLNRAGL